LNKKAEIGETAWVQLLVVQGDQKVSMHLMITVKKNQKYFKQFQLLTMMT
jgi:hypothetical protein